MTRIDVDVKNVINRDSKQNFSADTSLYEKYNR